MNESQTPEDHLNNSEISETIFQRLYLIYMPCCVVVGSTGNVMVWILIKSNRMLSKLPTNTYLLCLAAMSSLFLCTLFVFWLEEVSYLYFNVRTPSFAFIFQSEQAPFMRIYLNKKYHRTNKPDICAQ
uniref:G_PROTEIN_RECEP_F1_2 domain-containing protein n=1 Tax=Heterorhabditis bacteriophora TaxID=37862 RepID=A0A1I7XMM7_HETBA